MSRWTHSMCDDCWEKREPSREPVRLRQPEEEVCCFCGKPNQSGIYYRANPVETPCKGEGPSHKED